MRNVTLVLAAALTLALSACVPSPPPVVLPPQPSATPIFASEEEALAAAEVAYGDYWRAADQVGHAGWVDLESLRTFLTDRAWQDEQSQASELRSQGLTLRGASVASVSSLQSLAQREDQATIRVYACVDISATRLLNSDGEDVTPQNRHLVVPLEVTFLALSKDSLLIDRNDAWSGSSFC